MRVGAVVSPHKCDAFSDDHGRVAQQMYARFAIESLAVFLARIIIVIAQAGIDGGVEASKLGGHVRFEQRLNAEIGDVACNEHRIGMLGID